MKTGTIERLEIEKIAETFRKDEGFTEDANIAYISGFDTGRKWQYDKQNKERDLLIEALKDIIDSWNKRMGGDEEKFKTANISGHQLDFWSPVASLVDSEQIHKAKILLLKFG